MSPSGKVAASSPLTVEEEQDLVRRYQAGDRAAGDAIVRAHHKVIALIARRYARPTLERAELVHVTAIGFLKGAMRFNAKKARHGRLVPYARWWARAEVAQFAYEMRRLIGVSEYVEQALRFIFTHGPDNPKSREYLRSAAIRDALLVEESVLSLDAPMDNADGEGDPHTVEMRIADGGESPESLAMHAEAQGRSRAAIHEALGRLSEVERCVVILRCMTEPPVPPAEVAAGLGIRETTLPAVQRRALAKLGPLVRHRL